MICDWDVQTFEYWVELLEREGRDAGLPKCGIKMQDSYHFWDTELQEDLWWAPHVKDFTQLSPLRDPVATINDSSSDKDAPRIKWAAACRAPSINVPQYLLYLQSQARSFGVKVIKARLPTNAGFENALLSAESTAGRKADVFLNATGLGAAKLCGDEAMYPIRGQTVLVKGEAKATRTRNGDGYVAYCIPRPGSGMTILGGTKEVGNWSEATDPETTRLMLERNRVLAPELLTGEEGGFEVVSVQCGLRPGRRGGPRMERESVGGRRVVHAYGHASGGYQNSVGSARLVLRLVEESFGGGGVQATARL
ncbi:hypothetical protein LTR37_005263 [Vermiconidia calcicola]|uniref:Uncharacterized protein n=1 Tax=Vermiconidia calcicola TaxID=1690605 RepID=A0ACC3NJZ7_9PEZI|nr:hypothetical protein LTR37_005263 [Vermiconidia calcicola]